MKFNEGWGGTLSLKAGNMYGANYSGTFNYFEAVRCLSYPIILWECYYFKCLISSVVHVGPLVSSLLTRTDPHPFNKYWVLYLEEDCSYLANLFVHFIEEDQVNMACYTRCNFFSLAIGGAYCWDALWSDQQREEKHHLKENICSLILQCDTYLQEIHTYFTFLIGISDTLHPFIIHESPLRSTQTTLSVAQRDLKVSAS